MDASILIFYVVLMGAVWFLWIRPQQRKARTQRDMLSALEVGDDVLTSAGIYGTISEFDGGAVFLAVSDTLEIKISRESIAERVAYADED